TGRKRRDRFRVGRARHYCEAASFGGVMGSDGGEADRMRRCARGGGASWRADARGAVAVEFALILPVLMLIVVAIVNFGDMLSVRQSVSQAASEGARAAAVNPGTTTVKKAAARSAVESALAAQRQACSQWAPDDGTDADAT